MSAELEVIEIWVTKGGRIRRPRIMKFLADGHDLTPMVAPLSDLSVQREKDIDIARVTVGMIGRVILHQMEDA